MYVLHMYMYAGKVSSGCLRAQGQGGRVFLVEVSSSVVAAPESSASGLVLSTLQQYVEGKEPSEP